MVIVTCVISEKLLATLIRLHDAGRLVSLVSLDSSYEGGDIEGIRVFQIDPDKIDVDDPGHWDADGDEE